MTARNAATDGNALRAPPWASLGALVLLGALVAIGIYFEPSILYPLAGATLVTCVLLIAGALMVRDRPPETVAPEIEGLEREVLAPGRSPERVRALVLLLTRWPLLLDQLSGPMRLRLPALVREAGLEPTIREWASDSESAHRPGALHLAAWLDIERADEVLIDLLADPNREVAHTAGAALLRREDDRGLRALLDRLGASGAVPDSRIAAMLGGAPAERLLGVLAERAADPSSTRRFWIAHLAGATQSEAAFPLLMRLSHDPSPDVRANAAEGLGRSGREDARSRLHDLLLDPSWVVQAHAATALGALDPTLSIALLADALDSDHWWVRENARRALERPARAPSPRRVTA